jgi:hypothetical protein
MTDRREFPNSVKAEIVHRAAMPDGVVKCEGCGLVLGKKVYHIDHTIPDALLLDKSRPLTAKDGRLLGYDCCHKPKTAIDQGDIARAKRRERKHLGIRTLGNPIPGSKRSKWRKPFNGPPVLR